MKAAISFVIACALLSVLAVAPSRAYATQCQGTHRSLVVLTPRTTTLPLDGGILVGMLSAPGVSAKHEDLTSWRLRGHPDVEPVVLAPGLALFRPPAGARTIELHNGQQARARHRVEDSYGSPLPAPVVKQVVHALFPEVVGTTTTVELASPAPGDAIALVLFDGKGRPRTWGRVTGGTTSVVVYDDRLCASLPTGTFEPAPGESVTVAWVDARGLVSAASASVRVSR